MTVKAGDLLTVGGSVLIDRLQSAGPTVNQAQNRIYELGNYQSVDVTREIPDLTFPMESFDARAEMEAMLVGQASPLATYESLADGTEFDMSTCVALNALGAFKRGKRDAAPYDIAAGAIVPGLYVEQIQYRFGIQDNASQTVTLRGDSIHYNDASPYEQWAVGTNTAGQTIALGHSALPYNGDTLNGTRYAISVHIAETGERLFFQTDYTETVTGVSQAKTVSVVVTDPVPATQHVVVSYFSPTAANYPQASHAVASAVAPANIKGRDLELRVGGTDVTDRWSGVQATTIDWRVTLDRDEEFGNAYYVSQDFDVPDVTGTVDIKPRNIGDFITHIRQTSNVAAGEVIGPMSSAPLELELLLHSPVDGTILKTFYIPDAVFTLPGYSGRVQQKLAPTMNWASQGGQLYVYKGARP